MRLLVDANLAPLVADELRQEGHDVEHVFDVGLGAAKDTEILDYARSTDRIVVSSDSDFGTLLAQSGAEAPSFVLVRHLNELTPQEHAEQLRYCVKVAAEDLEHGAVVSIRPGHIRVRALPIGPVVTE